MTPFLGVASAVLPWQKMSEGGGNVLYNTAVIFTFYIGHTPSKGLGLTNQISQINVQRLSV